MNPPIAVAPEIESVLVAQPRRAPRADVLEPFVAAARDVLQQELGTAVQSGTLALENGACTTQEVTAIIGITGQLTGLALYGMSEQTALAIVSRMMGEPVEEIGDPLVHLLRNAIDHGVESAEDRRAADKPEAATVRLAAEHVENSIVITVEDDGRGIDHERIRANAVEKGIISPEAAARLGEGEAVDLIFASGFSTAAEVTDVSGRGVGMDIVRTNVERLGGTVEVETKLGRGSRFRLRLPLTLAIVQALLIRVAEGTYALPLGAVTETLRVPRAEIQRMQRQEAILLRGRVLPIVRLDRVFGCARTMEEQADVLVVAVKVGERQVGLAVDRLLGEQEVVIKSLGRLIGDVPGISSAAILGDGTVALIVDVPALIQRVATHAPFFMFPGDGMVEAMEADRADRGMVNGHHRA